MNYQDRKAVIKSMYMNLYKQEFSLGQLLVLSWDVFSKNFPILLLMGLILYIPVFIGSEVLLISELNVDRSIVMAITGIISLVVSLMVSLSYYRTVEFHLENKAITISEALVFSLQRLGKASLTAIIAGVIVGLLSLLLVIPGIIWAVYYAFIIFVVAERNIGGMDALAFSKSLVVGRWWKVLGYGFLISLLLASIIIILEAPISTFTQGLTTRLFSDILSIILSAYSTTAYILFYINLQHNRRPVNTVHRKTTF